MCKCLYRAVSETLRSRRTLPQGDMIWTLQQPCPVTRETFLLRRTYNSPISTIAFGAPMKKYNLGIIGAGMYGRVLMQHFRRDERASLIWVNSASEATTRAA